MKINNLKTSMEKLGSIDNYILTEDIGEGNFGKMKLGVYKPTLEQFAIKILNKQTIKEKMKNVDFRENEIITKFHHINIVNVFELIEDKNNYYIIMEYCQKGELFDYIVDKKKLSEEEASIFFYQLVNGVSYIHRKGIAHRDLKPENLLLTKDKVLKIIDFGLSHEFDGNILLKTKCGSPSYAAPEIIKGKSYDGFQIDSWCCGIILYAMVCGYLPFDGESNKELFKSILQCNPEYPSYLSKECKKLIKSILVTDPKKRITIEGIKETELYEKGKEYCKSFYKINLEELDRQSNYLIEEEKCNDNNDNDYSDENRIFSKIKVGIEENDKIEINNDEKDRRKIGILFGNLKDEDILNKYSIINTHSNSKNKINNIMNTFRQKIMNNNKNNLLTIKQNEEDNYRHHNILQTESNNYYKQELNKNPIKLNMNINSKSNNNNSLNLDFHSKHDNRFNINSNDYTDILNKIVSKRNNFNSPNSLLAQKQNLKFNRKLNLGSNNHSNDVTHLTSIKEKLNYFTDMNNNIIKNFDFDNNNIKNSKSVGSKRNAKKISPIKDGANILINANLYYNDINININNLNINNANDDLNKLNNTNLLQNSDKIKININNINKNENIGNFIKFKNNIVTKNDNDRAHSLTINRNENKAVKDNIYSLKNDSSYKTNLNNLMTNFLTNNKTLKNSFDLKNIKHRGFLKKKIFKNYYYKDSHSTNTYLNDNIRSKTINNNMVNIKNAKLEKTPKHISIKKGDNKFYNIIQKNIYNNTSGSDNRRNHNIMRISNKFESSEDKNKIQKGYKYQIALKEFLNLVQNNNNISNKMNNTENNNKDFLPYL